MYDLEKFLSDNSRFELIKSKIQKIETSKNEDLDQNFELETNHEFAKNNCLSCANCCRNYSPIIEEEEISLIQKSLGVSSETLFKDFIEMDEDGDFVFQSQPCPLLDLDTNKCKIYESRPLACREFPHTTNFPIKNHLELLEINASICPAAFNILERVII